MKAFLPSSFGEWVEHENRKMGSVGWRFAPVLASNGSVYLDRHSTRSDVKQNYDSGSCWKWVCSTWANDSDVSVRQILPRQRVHLRERRYCNCSLSLWSPDSSWNMVEDLVSSRGRVGRISSDADEHGANPRPCCKDQVGSWDGKLARNRFAFDHRLTRFPMKRSQAVPATIFMWGVHS